MKKTIFFSALALLLAAGGNGFAQDERMEDWEGQNLKPYYEPEEYPYRQGEGIRDWQSQRGYYQPERYSGRGYDYYEDRQYRDERTTDWEDQRGYYQPGERDDGREHRYSGDRRYRGEERMRDREGRRGNYRPYYEPEEYPYREEGVRDWQTQRGYYQPEAYDEGDEYDYRYDFDEDRRYRDERTRDWQDQRGYYDPDERDYGVYQYEEGEGRYGGRKSMEPQREYYDRYGEPAQ
jgi:hypothetical protein